VRIRIRGGLIIFNELAYQILASPPILDSPGTLLGLFDLLRACGTSFAVFYSGTVMLEGTLSPTDTLTKN